MRRKEIIIAIMCYALFSCSQQLYVPVSSDDTQQQQLLAGRKLYIDHCSSCHNLHLPNEYSGEVWTMKIDEMQQRAKITEEEKLLILKYLSNE